MADRYESNDSEIKEIRDEYTYARDQKRDIRDEGDTDMVYLLDPWKAKEQREDQQLREELGRPMVTADELGQYVNQLINDVRQNKRGIRVSPEGAMSSNKTAEFRQGLYRQIEYRSNAALEAYPVMFENTAQRSYGYLRIQPVYENYRSRHQELRIKAIPNPNMVTEDPHGLASDGSDWKFVWFAESWTLSDFKRKWARAKVQSFDPEMFRDAKDFLQGNNRILVGERWRIVTRKRRLLYIDPPMGYQGPPLDEFEDALDLARLPAGVRFVGNREVDYPSVHQQIFNGVEVLEERQFKTTTLPFVACYGKIMFVDDGSGPKKHILSLPRLARSPYMLYCYYRSQQAEIAGQIPKTPIGGYRGQFAGYESDFERLPHEPMAFVEFNFTTDGWNPQWGPMPPPSRLQVSQAEHLQALELCAEGARRAIQASMGVSPLPTQAQRRNEKSGVALKQIEDTAQKGSFHFIDHFDLSITRTGIVLDDWTPHYYDAARTVTVRKPDDTPISVSINDPSNPEAVSAVDGNHDVTISVGPRQISEREAASDFADSILASPLMQQLPPEKAMQLYALAIKLKAVGPIGDEMADMLAPKAGGKPTAEEVQALQAQVQQLEQALQQAQMEMETQAAKQQATIEKAHIDAQASLEKAHVDNAADIRIAEINAATKGYTTEAAHAAAHESQALGHAVELSQADAQRQHEADMAARQAAIAEDAAQQAHGRSLEAGDVAHQQALEQQAAQPRSEGQA